MILIKWLISAIALLLTAYLLPGIEVASFYIALVVALFLGIVNIVLKPILVVLTLPITVMTLGLFTFVINGFLFWLLSTFIQGFIVDGFLIAIVGAFVVSVFSYLGNTLLGNKD